MFIFQKHKLLENHGRICLYQMEHNHIRARGSQRVGEGPDILIPLGINSVIIHSKQHTMSMMVMFLQLDNINLERLCLLFTQLVRERHQEAQEQHRTEDIC